MLDEMDGGEWTRREAERTANHAELLTRLNDEAAQRDAQDDDDAAEVLEPQPF